MEAALGLFIAPTEEGAEILRGLNWRTSGARGTPSKPSWGNWWPAMMTGTEPPPSSGPSVLPITAGRRLARGAWPGSYCAGCRPEPHAWKAGPGRAAPPPPASCRQFVCRGLHTHIELPIFFPVSSAVSRNSPPVQLLSPLLLFLEPSLVCLAAPVLRGCARMRMRMVMMLMMRGLI